MGGGVDENSPSNAAEVEREAAGEQELMLKLLTADPATSEAEVDQLKRSLKKLQAEREETATEATGKGRARAKGRKVPWKRVS